ncbi:MAG TPA: bifunctional enoyl-CoA hydratase/phosphate acetyltransferase [Bacillota bacterium]|nr:bifunctional enoyl-CoA hydratase/phosphate acetyltransferase [Bacillota bacterium]
MIPSFDCMGDRIVDLGLQRIAVAAAQDDDVLLSIDNAARLGIAEPLLIGRRSDILKAGERCGVNAGGYEIIEEEDDIESCRIAVRLIREGQADAIMKGLVSTAYVLKAILNRETGIRDGELLSHIGLFFIPKTARPVMITDPAMSIAPDVNTKKHIIENAVQAAHLMGLPEPRVACVCALEKVNPAMQATVDAEELVRMNADGELTGCVVGGPFALDNALFKEAASHKGITDPVAGNPDILLMPNIEAGNILYKALAFLCDAPGAGLVLGAKSPVILTSRSDSKETKLHSIILALYLAAEKKRLETEERKVSAEEPQSGDRQ